MLAKRIIPTLLVSGRKLVKGKQFNSWRSVGVAEQAARIYAQRGVDELILLDIAATPEGRGPDFAMIERMTEGNFCPISVGGGIRSVEDVHDALLAGADKVIIGTAAYRNPNLISDCAAKFGNQAIVVCIDYTLDDCYWLVTDCGTRTHGMSAYAFALQMQKAGAGEVMIQSLYRDGMMEGYDIETIKHISSSLDIPVIASGGCGSYEHMYDAIKAGADAVAASSLFLFADSTPAGAAEYLSSRGIPCRT